jgi:hypothetical protein
MKRGKLRLEKENGVLAYFDCKPMRAHLEADSA